MIALLVLYALNGLKLHSSLAAYKGQTSDANYTVRYFSKDRLLKTVQQHGMDVIIKDKITDIGISICLCYGQQTFPSGLSDLK